MIDMPTMTTQSGLQHAPHDTSPGQGHDIRSERKQQKQQMPAFWGLCNHGLMQEHYTAGAGKTNLTRKQARLTACGPAIWVILHDDSR